MGAYTFLLIDIIVIGVPLIFSFEKRLHFISHKWHVLTSALLVSIVFIPWYSGITAIGITRFNPDYNLKFNLGNLPFEVYLYFFTTPFLCLFIYAWLKLIISKNFLKGAHFAFTPFFIIGLVLLLLNSFDQTYTALSLSFLALLLLIQLVNGKRYMGKFYLSFVISIIPLWIIDIILTSLRMLDYNPRSMIGIKLGNWPIDTLIFDAGLCLLAVMGYEWSKRRFFNGHIAEVVGQ